MNTLQIAIITFSIIVAVVALLIFGGILPGFRATAPGEAGEIAFWGTLPQKTLASALEDFSRRFRNIKVEYKEIDAKNYINELVGALAAGQGPDVFLLPQDQIVRQRDLIFTLDSKTYPLRAFRDSFADIGELYVKPEGVIGLPLYIDPLVLYWNRDLFRNAGQTQPPKFWDEFLEAAKTLTIKDGMRIVQAGTAMGESSNIRNSKDVLALLMLQTGNKITDPATLRPVFAQKPAGAALSPAEEAFLFFTSFANSIKENYSWNRAQPEAIQAFGAGRLAMYLGYASEIEQILALNPHLNFDAAEVPQIRGGTLRSTYGKSAALALSAQSPNKATALTFMYEMTGQNAQVLLGQNSFLAPALRNVLGSTQKNPVLEVFYRSAVRALGWLDPDPEASMKIWEETVLAISSGAKSFNQAVSDAQRKFETLIPEQN